MNHEIASVVMNMKAEIDYQVVFNEIKLKIGLQIVPNELAI
jgi:hypothetical protein